jgi:hypothetical protein
MDVSRVAVVEQVTTEASDGGCRSSSMAAVKSVGTPLLESELS